MGFSVRIISGNGCFLREDLFSLEIEYNVIIRHVPREHFVP